MTEGGVVSFVERRGCVRAIELPCGQCIGCRVQRSQEWSVRIMHEASLHDASCFVTLTYDDDHVSTSLDYTDFQLFMKRLRKRIGKPIRFFMCGEYGERFERPHFHVCIFGTNFYDDRYPWRKTGQGHQVYRSSLLEDCWSNGLSEVGELTLESAAYVARYCVKKVTGRNAEAHYEATDIRTGEITRREPEFARMSLKPGIGLDWIRLYYNDILSQRGLLVNGKRASLPRFYKKYLADLVEYDTIRSEAELKAYLSPDNSPDRLAVREFIAKAKLSVCKRNLE